MSARRIALAALAALTALAATSLLLAGCASDNPHRFAKAKQVMATAPANIRPTETPPPAPETAQRELVPKAPVVPTLVLLSKAVDEPLAVIEAPSHSGRLWVADKGGKVVSIAADGAGPVETVLDLSDEVSGDSEQGLLSMALSPTGNELIASWTNIDGDSRVAGFAVRGDTVDKATRRSIFELHQPYANHNGGHVVFGPDGALYLGLGDGGSADDPAGNGQNPATQLGKMLRFSPLDRQPETWLLGLRNPWRFSFDRLTGDLWIGDVGQNRIEEIDLLKADPAGTGRGANLGWNAFEGSERFDKRTPTPAQMVPPLFEYRHEGGACSITGGFVYRGRLLRSSLWGAYVYADYCLADLWSLTVSANGLVTATPFEFQVPEGRIASFAETGSGELLVLTVSPGAIYRLTAR